MSLKILIIGSNSRVFSAIKNSGVLNDFDVLSVSGKNLDISTDRICEEIYSAVVILSYSKDLMENKLLFSKLSNVRSKIFIYISSISALCAELGYKYSYPSSKFRSEELAKCHFKKLKILRIGLVPEVHKPPYGHCYITHASDLANCIIYLARGLELADNFYLKNLYINQANLFEKIAYSLYKKLFQFMGHKVIFLRPIDFMLRVLGYNWYGYHMAINMKSSANA